MSSKRRAVPVCAGANHIIIVSS
eukprot:SAG25_NODE_10051_length_347_cov_1.036290_1_plen_22_part_01